ncbi:MAG: HD domain-containing protein [Halobacteriota archaeon]|nr:HD domain-containing protein [Halobacteriota archaeon]
MKVIRDPLHGHIEVDEIGLKLLDTRGIQRLRRIRQLGFSHLVYPGANHTRFEHSLGTYHLTDLLLKQLKIENEELKAAALLHDVCHGPYSHATEKVLFRYTKKTHEDVEKTISTGQIGDVLEEFSLSPKNVAGHVMGSSDLQVLHSEIDVDRMDYLVRDAYYTGVAFGLVDHLRLIHEMYILNGDLVVKIEGIKAVESLLVSRFLMRPTVYYHHVSRIAESMFARALELMIEDHKLELDALKTMDDYELNMAMRRSGGYPGEIIGRINNRRLFKRAIYVGPESVNIESIKKDKKRMEKEITEVSGLEDGYVILDLPEEPKIEEIKAKVLIDDEIKQLHEVSYVVKMLELAERESWRVGVYTPEEHKDEVEKAARDILNVERKPKQQFLVEFY